MSDGVLYKFNATTWSKSQAKKFNATSISDGVVKHANASAWFKNYPMEQLYTDTFTATWSQGWRGDGVRLDDGVWQGNILVGSTTNYRGMFGFDQSKIAAFIGSGVVQSAKLLVNCYETTTNGSPDVIIGKHAYNSKPAGTWTEQNTDWTNLSNLHVPNQALGGYWVTLSPSQIRLWNGVAVGGFVLKGQAATDENHGKFNGVSSFTTKLEITVLK